MHSKSLFALCHTCAEPECNHEDPRNREFVRTMRRAKKISGSGIRDRRCIQNLAERNDTVRSNHQGRRNYWRIHRHVLTLKTPALGYLAYCTTEKSIERYISEFEKIEDTKVNENSIKFNPLIRFVIKFANHSALRSFSKPRISLILSFSTRRVNYLSCCTVRKSRWAVSCSWTIKLCTSAGRPDLKLSCRLDRKRCCSVYLKLCYDLVSLS